MGLGDEVLPVNFTLFNLREASKQIILLEDHLLHKERRCTDCIEKHFLAIEAFLEEGGSLQGSRVHKELCARSNSLVRAISASWLNKEDPILLAGKLRELRKTLVSGRCIIFRYTCSPFSKQLTLVYSPFTSEFRPPWLEGGRILLNHLLFKK